MKNEDQEQKSGEPLMAARENDDDKTVAPLLRMLDYMIVEGAMLRAPIVVYLLRLTRQALLDEMGARRSRLD